MFRALFFAMTLLLAGPSMAAPKAELWDRWVPQAVEGTEQPDHRMWDSLLRTYVRRGDAGVNLVDYAGFSRDGRAQLDAYLGHLSDMTPSRLSRPGALAYWINLYNALTVHVVLDHLPVDSIRDIDISPGLFSDGPWGAALVRVEGHGLSLDDIEHRILRPVWQDPRIHYAVNCASIGCPDLQAGAYWPDQIKDQLEAAAHAFIGHERALRIEGGRLTVSSIYDWFQADFGGGEASVIAHLRHYAVPEIAGRLIVFHAIDEYRYDWHLNGFRAGR